jgi:hypothetical protein
MPAVRRPRGIRRAIAAAGGLAVTDLAARAGLAEPAAARHLGLLVAAGLARRPGGTADRYAPAAGVVAAGPLVRVRVGGSVPSYTGLRRHGRDAAGAVPAVHSTERALTAALAPTPAAVALVPGPPRRSPSGPPPRGQVKVGRAGHRRRRRRRRSNPAAAAATPAKPADAGSGTAANENA